MMVGRFRYAASLPSGKPQPHVVGVPLPRLILQHRRQKLLRVCYHIGPRRFLQRSEQRERECLEPPVDARGQRRRPPEPLDYVVLKIPQF